MAILLSVISHFAIYVQELSRLRLYATGSTDLAFDKAFHTTTPITMRAVKATTPAPTIAPATAPVVRWSPFDELASDDLDAAEVLAVDAVGLPWDAVVKDELPFSCVAPALVEAFTVTDDFVADGVVVIVVVVGVVVVDVEVVVVYKHWFKYSKISNNILKLIHV